jgi:pimeloyl-ACP methyl ester carboxylesterase
MTNHAADHGLLTHHSARVNDVLIHYVTAGAGEPVILLHGFAQTWYEWRRHIMPSLATKYYVIAPDLRGMGDSERLLTHTRQRTETR